MNTKASIRIVILTLLLAISIFLLCGCGLIDPDSCPHLLGGINRDLVFSDYGFCSGAVTYQECFFCMNNNMIPDNVILSCNFEVINSDQGTDENGNKYWGEESRCSVCGLIMHTGEVYYYEGCEMTAIRAYQFISADGEVILEGNYVWGDVDHDWEHTFTLLGESCKDGVFVHALCRNCGKEGTDTFFDHDAADAMWVDKSIDLSKLGMCGEGSVFEIASCPCGEMVYAGLNEAVEINCQWEKIGDSYTDENGELHTVEDMHCSVCDSTIHLDSREIVNEGCCFDYVIDTKIVINDETVVDGSYTRGGEVKHDYEYSYELYGEYCTDGTNYVTILCKRCGDSNRYMSEGHIHDEYDIFEYGMSTNGICSNIYITVSVCPCGMDTSFYFNIDEGCLFDDAPTEFFIDDDGCEHIIIKRTCTTCGLVITEESYYTNRENCESKFYIKKVIEKNGAVLYDSGYQVEQIIELHDYKYEYVLRGESCVDGVSVLATCPDCGHFSTWEQTNHITAVLVESIDLSEYGMCGDVGCYNKYKCICGHNGYIRGELITDESCDWVDLSIGYYDENGDWVDTTESYADENGIVYYVSDYVVCKDCGMVRKKISWAPDESDPIAWSYCKEIVIIDGETVIEYTYPDSTKD